MPATVIVIGGDSAFSFTGTPRPTTAASPPKWRCQKPWLMTIVVGRAGASSLAVSQRPRPAGVPTVGKNDDETAATSACAGSALSTSCRSQFTEPTTARCSKDRDRRCQSSVSP